MGEESEADPQGGQEAADSSGSDLVAQLIEGLAERLGLDERKQNAEDLSPEESQVAKYHEHLGARIETGAPIGRFGRPDGRSYRFKGLR